MKTELLVKAPDGSLAYKQRGQLLPTDVVIVDGPDAFAGVDAIVADFEAEVAAAGGLDAWKAQGPSGGSPGP
jgi:hypothetical protein